MGKRADSKILHRLDEAHVLIFKAHAGMGAVILEGHEIDAIVRYIEALEQEAARRTTPDREAWISVDESLPEPGACDVLAWNNEGWYAVVHSEYVSPAFPEYTHWMPLPTAPTSDKGGA